MTPKQHFRRLQLRLEIAEFGMGMPLDRERVKELREQVEQARKDATMDLYYEAENINARLNRMNETELASDAAHRLMDRLAEIRELEHMDSDGFNEQAGGY
jgi:hypothetical protein